MIGKYDMKATPTHLIIFVTLMITVLYYTNFQKNNVLNSTVFFMYVTNSDVCDLLMTLLERKYLNRNLI